MKPRKKKLLSLIFEDLNSNRVLHDVIYDVTNKMSCNSTVKNPWSYDICYLIMLDSTFRLLSRKTS